MEAVAALSLACNIMQLVDVGIAATSFIKEAYKLGDTARNIEARSCSESLSVSLKKLEESFSEQINQEDHELAVFGRQTAKKARELQEKLRPFEKRSLKNAMKSFWHRSDVITLQDEITSYKETLNTKLLIDLRRRHEFSNVESTAAFTQLDADLQSFIRHQATIQLEEHGKTREAVRDEGTKISVKLDALVLASKDEEAVKRFLSSLHFSSMNERKNTIGLASDGTFEWMYKSSEDDTSDAYADTDVEDFVDEGSGSGVSGSIATDEEFSRDETASLERSSEKNADKETENSCDAIATTRSIEDKELDTQEIVGAEEHPESPNTESTDLQEFDKDVTTSGSSILEASESSEVDSYLWTNEARTKRSAQAQLLRDWLRSADDNFWISGKAGSGKSTLMKFIANHSGTSKNLQQWAGYKQTIIIQAYIWNAGDDLQKSFRGVLATLLLQILDTSDHKIQLVVRARCAGGRKLTVHDWTTNELESEIFHLAQSSHAFFCIFVDGLDELQAAQSQSEDVLLRYIDRLSQLPNVKFCLSSRPEILFKNWFAAAQQIKLEELNAHDIELFFSNGLHEICRNVGAADATVTRLGKHELAELQRTFVVRAEGIFLWAQLVLKTIIRSMRKLDDHESLCAHLQSLPKDLEPLFELMWSRDNDDLPKHRREAADLFTIALASLEIAEGKNRRHLSWLKIGTLLQFTLLMTGSSGLDNQDLKQSDMLIEACDQTARLIESRCAGLLQVDSGTAGYTELLSRNQRSVRLVHRTAKDFLLFSPAGQRILASATQFEDAPVTRFLRALIQEVSLSFRPIPYPLLDDLLDWLRANQDSVPPHEILGCYHYLETALNESAITNDDPRSTQQQLSHHYKTLARSNRSDTPPLDYHMLILGFRILLPVYSLLESNAKRCNPMYCALMLQYLRSDQLAEAELHQKLVSLLTENIHLVSNTGVYMEQLGDGRPRKVNIMSSMLRVMLENAWDYTYGDEELFAIADAFELIGMRGRTAENTFDRSDWCMIRASDEGTFITFSGPRDEYDLNDSTRKTLSILATYDVVDAFWWWYRHIDPDLEVLEPSEFPGTAADFFSVKAVNFGYDTRAVSDEYASRLSGMLSNAEFCIGAVDFYDLHIPGDFYELARKAYKRGLHIDVDKYLGQEGYFVPSDDPRIIREPPKMFLERKEMRALRNQYKDAVKANHPEGLDDGSLSDDQFNGVES